MAAAQSAADLVRPTLERIVKETAGRKYAKLRQDVESLLSKLDVLLAVYPSVPAEQLPEGTADSLAADARAAAAAAAAAAPDASAAVSLQGDGAAGAKLQVRVSEDGGAAAPSPANGAPPRAAPTPSAAAAGRAGALADGPARQLLLALHDAVDTRRPPIVDAALDCLQRLVAFRLLRGPVTAINHRREGLARADAGGAAPLAFAAQPPQAQALELMCRCDDLVDDAVELRLLRGLLSAVTSPALGVHGQALLLAVRAAYNVFLVTRSDVNATTARAALTQMLAVVFQRLEAGSAAVVVPPVAVSGLLGLPPADAGGVSAFVQQFLSDVAAAVDPFGAAAEGVARGLDDAFAGPVSPRDGDEAGGGFDAALAAAAAASPAPAAAPLTADDDADAFAAGGAGPGGGGAAAQLERDAFLTFRALCKLSARDAGGGAGGAAADLAALRGRVLALELLKVVLDNAGPRFAGGERFVGAIRQYLCLSLLKNAGSPVPAVARLCASIFLALLLRFRAALKAEVGVFFPMIVLRPLEPGPGGGPPAGGAPARAVALRCLHAAAGDGQLLVDVFVNYDCDLEGANLFERAVTAAVRAAQGGTAGGGAAPAAAEPASPADEQAIRYEALRCLVAMLASMQRFYRDGAAEAPAAAGDGAAPAEPAGEDGAPARGLPPSASEDALAAGAAPAGLAVGADARSRWLATLAAGGPAAAAAAPQGELLEAWKAFKRTFERGVALFNAKPAKGIAFLQEQRLLGPEPAEVAAFLAATRGLDKAVVGDYLGERDGFPLAVMRAYVDALDFTGAEFDGAIRTFLAGFRLPGEAQKIDRLMEKFAERYTRCNPGAFKSADVAYVLAYSVIMLNTDAHNPMVKNKMTLEAFLRNNRGINDGGDLPVAFMEGLYARITTNEIKMRDEDPAAAAAGAAAAAKAAAAAAGWMDTLAALVPGGRARAAAPEPSDEAVRATLAGLRARAAGATFYRARDGEAVRPMLDVAWAPMLGAFSTVFEGEDGDHFANLSLNGLVAASRLACALRVPMLRDTFVSSLARAAHLHDPPAMRAKHAYAFRALLAAAEEAGDGLGPAWLDVLRACSRFEELQQAAAGAPTDALLFAAPAPATPGGGGGGGGARGGGAPPPGATPARPGSGAPAGPLPPAAAAAVRSVDVEEIGRLFVHSSRLRADAVVAFMRALVAVAREELAPEAAPRVFCLTRIVEAAHFNIGRIRLVWGAIWAELGGFFADVGCHPSLGVALYSIDALRQLAVKLLAREELANYTFQADLLKPFVAVMRRSRAVEARELVIRCAAQLVAARAASIKSGWKSMFQVLTAAAGDGSPAVVSLAFGTVERVVREYFPHVTETEAATFTDCVNCLAAFTNNPHSLDVALNAIAFLRFCAERLAEGDVDGGGGGGGGEADGAPAAPAAAAAPGAPPRSPPRLAPGEREHYWFPLLAGLSELALDARPEVSRAAVEVLFDILEAHGGGFSPRFWGRVFDSVLAPIFDVVRAQAAGATTFAASPADRAADDAWLYDAATRALARAVDVGVRYAGAAPGLLAALLDLVLGFVRRPHAPLAAAGVAAAARLLAAAPRALPPDAHARILAAWAAAAADALPDVAGLVATRAERRAGGAAGAGRDAWSLGAGAGARRLAEVACRAETALLVVDACAGAVAALPPGREAAAPALLDVLAASAAHARAADADAGLRHSLALAQAADGVPPGAALPDPPLLRLEAAAAAAYLGALAALAAAGGAAAAAAGAEDRMAALCAAVLERFQRYPDLAAEAHGGGAGGGAPGGAEGAALAPLAANALRALRALPAPAFHARLGGLFPLLTSLISCEHAPPEVQDALSELFQERVSGELGAEGAP